MLSLVGIVVQGFHFSIDFVGGAEITYNPTTPVTADEVNTVLSNYGLTGEVQLLSGGDEISIRTDSLGQLQDQTALLAGHQRQGEVEVLVTRQQVEQPLVLGFAHGMDCRTPS